MGKSKEWWLSWSMNYKKDCQEIQQRIKHRSLYLLAFTLFFFFICPGYVVCRLTRSVHCQPLTLSWLVDTHLPPLANCQGKWDGWLILGLDYHSTTQSSGAAAVFTLLSSLLLTLTLSLCLEVFVSQSWFNSAFRSNFVSIFGLILCQSIVASFSFHLYSKVC